MRIPFDDDEEVVTPFPTSPVSNGEWVPGPITKTQQTVRKVISEEAEQVAKRHAMSRSQFLKTAAGTLLGFSVLNRVHGLDAWGDNAVLPIRKVECEDLDAARERLDIKPWYIVDVQSHHVDVSTFGSLACFLRFCEEVGEPDCGTDPTVVSQANYIREMFVDSETHVAVISGLPSGTPLGPAAMADTAALANRLADSERCLTQAVIDPNYEGRTIASLDEQTRLETMQHQVDDLGARAVKTYTYNGNWRMDDETIAYPMLAEAQRLGLRLINVHKGLPALFAPGSEESVRTTDFPKAVADWPKLRFCAYHSGYFGQGSHPEGKAGISEFIEILESMPKKHRKRVYAEVGSTFAITLLQEGVAPCGRGGTPPTGPLNTAHYMGQLLKTCGSKNILWGTDSIWWGSPQWLIDAFKVLQIPASLREEFGYPQLTKKAKKRIFGKNAAKLYGIKKKMRRQHCSIPAASIDTLDQEEAQMSLPGDRLAALQAARGGPHEGRGLRVYGPQTRREFVRRFGWNYG